MADATKLPTSTQMRYFDWKGDPHFTRNPAIDGSGTYTLYWSVAPLDKDDAIITGAFEVSAIAKDGENYTFWVPASAVSADGLSATGCVGGIRPNGLDYTTGDTDFAPTTTTSLVGGKIVCGIPAVLGELIRSAIQGAIQTGGATIDIGTGASEDVYIKHNGNPWLKQTSAGVAQYYNGSSYVNLNDSIASSLVKVSATDTTPDYLSNKFTSSDSSIVFDVTGDGGDESYDLTTSLPARISSHAIYTPAYMTGGASAETNTALWDSVTDGSFRATIDGTAYNFDGIDFSAITSMETVASTIQTKMQTVTGTSLTVVWSTDHFVITSANTTSSSEISVLTTSTGTVGTDISGAGAGTWMDSETGRGTATAAVLDPTQDSGKVGLLNARGSFPSDLARDFVDPLGYQAKGGIMVATAANTVDEQVVGANDFGFRADSAQGTGVKWVPTSRILALLNTPVTVANTTTETTLLTATVPANTLSTTNEIIGEIFISDLDVEASADDNLTLRLKYGSTTVAAVGVNNGSGDTNQRGVLRFRLTANAATNAQKGTMTLDTVRDSGEAAANPDTIDLAAYSVNNNRAFASSTGTAAEVSTSSLSISVTAQWSGLGAGDSITAEHGDIILIA